MSEFLQGLAGHWPLVPFAALYAVSRLVVRASASRLTEDDVEKIRSARTRISTLIGLSLLVPIALAFIDLRAALIAWGIYGLLAVTYNFVWCTRFDLPRRYRNGAALGNLIFVFGIAVLGFGYFWPGAR